mmetsp:Transcript_39049/g.90899  ORF Transcript_39049/g.90899 Transcript_39049/m.90899 type:complete len:397 (+) Transcript_39049:308-1498(+)
MYMAVRIDALKDLDLQYQNIRREYARERLALEAKYFAMATPLYDKRRAVVTGECDEMIMKENKDMLDQLEEVVESLERAQIDPQDDVDTDDVSEKDEDKQAKDEEEKIRGVPQFWVCAMGHCEAISELITENDVDCLDHLIDVRCEMHVQTAKVASEDEDDDEEEEETANKAATTDVTLSGFTLHFYFDIENNPYFTNSVLSKKYIVPNMLDEGEEPMLKECTGCTIDWKSDMSLTYRKVLKKQRAANTKGKKKNMVRTITALRKTDSFFHFFDPPKLPGHGPEEGELNEAHIQDIEDAFDRDWDVATAIRCQLVPRAVAWFTGEALEEELEENDEDEEEGEEGKTRLEFASPQLMAEGGGVVAMFPAGNLVQGDRSNPFPPGTEKNGEDPDCKQS